MRLSKALTKKRLFREWLLHWKSCSVFNFLNFQSGFSPSSLIELPGFLVQKTFLSIREIIANDSKLTRALMA